MIRIKQFCKYFFAISFVLVACFSCSSDEPEMDDSNNPSKQPEEKIEYYVKYESNMSINVSGHIDVYVKVMTEKGEQTIGVPRSWEGVFGPFDEFKTLSISVKAAGYWNQNATSCRARISVCRGNQPFILKADKSFSGTSGALSYTVTKDDLK